MKADALIQKALEDVARLRDGGAKEEDLIAILAAAIHINVPEEKQRRAKEMIDRRTKPKSTEPSGQLCFVGMDPYPYEPDRLIRDDEGRIIEQKRAAPPYKRAEAKRANKHLEEAAFWAKIKNEEDGQFAQWAYQQIKKGRKQRDIVWGNFIIETGIWKKEEEDG